jgi:hypothetical protein
MAASGSEEGALMLLDVIGKPELPGTKYGHILIRVHQCGRKKVREKQEGTTQV